MSVRRIRFHAVTGCGTKRWQFNESNRNATPLYLSDKPLSDASLYSRLLLLHITSPASKVDYRSDPSSVACCAALFAPNVITRRGLWCAIANHPRQLSPLAITLLMSQTQSSRMSLRNTHHYDALQLIRSKKQIFTVVCFSRLVRAREWSYC